MGDNCTAAKSTNAPIAKNDEFHRIFISKFEMNLTKIIVQI